MLKYAHFQILVRASKSRSDVLQINTNRSLTPAAPSISLPVKGSRSLSIVQKNKTSQYIKLDKKVIIFALSHTPKAFTRADPH